MRSLYRIVFATVMFVAAFTCYAMGVQSGAAALFVLGFSLEIFFWLALFKPKASRRFKSSA